MADIPSLKVSEVMTKEVLAIDVNDTLDTIAGLFEKYDYEGMPVIDSSHMLVGTITTHDLILQSVGMHLPTLLKLMDQVVHGKSDQKVIEQHFGKLRNIKATSIMNPKIVSVRDDEPVEEAARIFADYQKINPLPVVDAAGKLVGVLSRSDIIRFFNQTYLQRVMSKVQEGGDRYHEFPTRSQRDVEAAVDTVREDFLIVSKRRPLIWKYVAFAMFAVGLVVATALIVRIVQNGG